MSQGVQEIPEYGGELKIQFVRLTPEVFARYVETQFFDCGSGPLNDYFREKALGDRLTTYLFVDAMRGNVIAYCTFCCSGIMEIVKTNEVFFGSDDCTITPAMEIKYFAVSKAYQHKPFSAESPKGETLSRFLLNYIQSHLCKISEDHISADKIILYAVKKAITFYTQCGFIQFSGTMLPDRTPVLNGCCPMYYDI